MKTKSCTLHTPTDSDTMAPKIIAWNVADKVIDPCPQSFHKRLLVFAIDCPCGVWCRELTTFPCMLGHVLEILFEIIVDL